MKLRDFYRLAVETGIKYDPRGKEGVKKYINKIRTQYSALSPKDKKFFDKEKLTNPFSDTRVLYGDLNKNIKTAMIGVDMETPEILLAQALNKQGKRIDLVVSHHPQGFARHIFYEVMNVQLDMLKALGVNEKKAKKLLNERMEEVKRKVLSDNAMRPANAAELLGIAYMCMHTVADNMVSHYLSEKIKRRRPKRVADVVDLLIEEPEYKYGATINSGPTLILGKMKNPCGKIMLEMTGGTEGSKKIFPELKKAGIKTIIGMHMSEEHFKKAKKYKLNILVAGHMASDNLGLNLLLDEIDKKNTLKIIPCSGFIRVRRKR